MPEIAATEQLLSYALCTPSDVQIAMQGRPATGSSPQQIARLINLFTELVQGPQYLNRLLEIIERTSYFDIADPCGPYTTLRHYRARVPLPAMPIAVDGDGNPLIEVWSSSARVYDDDTKLDLFEGYDIDIERGVLRCLGGCQFAAGPRALKVTWTGGLVTPASDAPKRDAIAPEDLRHACAMQVAAWFTVRKDLAVDSIAIPGGGAISLSDPTKMLAAVRAVLNRYRVFTGPC